MTKNKYQEANLDSSDVAFSISINLLTLCKVKKREISMPTCVILQYD
jgi:hypothetical protein